MTTGRRHAVSFVEQFLGAEAARGGPCALLGLPPDGFSDLDIISARDRRMQAIDAHPQGQSPASDEVRLALHAATAQLLNPAIRSHLRRGQSSSARAAAMVGLEQDVILTLAMFGGWTRKSLPRLMALAHSRGLRASDVAETLRHMSTRRRNTSAAQGASPDDAFPSRSAVSRNHWSIVIGLVAILMIVGTVWTVLVVTGDRALVKDTGTQSALMDAAPPSQPGLLPTDGDAASAKPQTTTVPRMVVERDAILDTLLHAVSIAESDLDGAHQSAVAATEALSADWLELPAPVRTRAMDAIVELMYRLGGPTGDARALLNTVGRGSIVLRSRRGTFDQEEVERAVWSIGALTRIRRERDLSAQSHALIDRWLGASLDGSRPAQLSFAGGALACLQSIMDGLATQPDERGSAWTGWARAAAAVTASDAERRVSLLSRGAERLLVQSIDPEARNDMYEAIEAVIRAMPWRNNDDSKRWMVRQFDNRNVPASSLSAATRTLVAATDADNIDPTMVLSASANDLDRRSLRDQYLLAWGLESPGSDIAILDALTNATGQLDAELKSVRDSNDALGIAVSYARISAAASAHWQGDAVAANLILSNYAVQPGASPNGSGADMGSESQDGRWGEQFLLAGVNTEERMRLLAQLRSSTRRQLGSVDAEVLVEAALRGGGRAVRDAARDIVELFGSSPAIVNALLEESPRMAPTPMISELIVSVTGQPLPDWTNPEWRLAVRRALVERLLELIAADSIVAGVDELARLLDEAYDQRTSSALSMTDSGDVIVASAERSVRELRARWTRAAQRGIPAAGFALTINEVARRLEGRRSLAVGMVQEFAVEQLALAETMAVVVVSEQSSHRAAVETVLEDLSQSRRDASHIFYQIAAAERAMAKLWEIRLGVNGL